MMYKSPITKETEDIMQEIVLKEEECLMRSVHKVGFEIDKEELRKALQYDRDQYEKGFIDGELSAKPKWISVKERLPEPDTIVLTIDENDMYEINWIETETGVWAYSAEAWMPLPEPWKGEER